MRSYVRILFFVSALALSAGAVLPEQQSVELQRFAYVVPFAATFGLMGALTLFLFAMPAVLQVIFAARPLPPGPLRDRLDRLCRIAETPCRDLYTFSTGRARLANAFVTGLSPRTRRIFFTDALLEKLEPEEVEAVLAHEIVHAKRRHILFFFLFSLAYLTCAIFLHEWAAGWIGHPGLVGPVMLTFALFVWVVVFGAVSRRFETEADLVGLKILKRALPEDSPPDAALHLFSHALMKVGAANHVSSATPSLRHFSISGRVGLLHASSVDPRIGLRIEKTCAGIRATVSLLVLLAAAYWSHSIILQIHERPERQKEWDAILRAERGYRLLAQGKAGEAAELLRSGIEGGAEFSAYYLALADALEATDDPAGARRARDKARDEGVVDPDHRLRLRRTLATP